MSKNYITRIPWPRHPLYWKLTNNGIARDAKRSIGRMLTTGYLPDPSMKGVSILDTIRWTSVGLDHLIASSSPHNIGGGDPRVDWHTRKIDTSLYSPDYDVSHLPTVPITEMAGTTDNGLALDDEHKLLAWGDYVDGAPLGDECLAVSIGYLPGVIRGNLTPSQWGEVTHEIPLVVVSYPAGNWYFLTTEDQDAFNAASSVAPASITVSPSTFPSGDYVSTSGRHWLKADGTLIEQRIYQTLVKEERWRIQSFGMMAWAVVKTYTTPIYETRTMPGKYCCLCGDGSVIADGGRLRQLGRWRLVYRVDDPAEPDKEWADTYATVTGIDKIALVAGCETRSGFLGIAK